MKKIFLTLVLASFVGATTMSASTFGDDKNKKECKKDCKKGDKACCKKGATTETKTTTDKK